jgi:hypothetical protein
MMLYEGLQTDFNNIRETQSYAVGKVVDEAQKYIEFLEGKNAFLEKLIEYLNELDGSGKNETKEEILAGLAKISPPE